MSIRRFYAGKSIFITGCTGFLGKVVLEKILRDLPTIDKIYILTRPKKKFSAEERLHREIIDSPIFNRLRKERSDFDAFIRSKLVAVTGDVLDENLGLSAEDLQLIINNVNIIVHCAATVGFHERLDDAIRLNVLGPLRVLGLAKSAKRLEALVHVSTAYVNSNRDEGPIDEKLYPLDLQPEEVVKMILGMDPKEVEEITPSLLGRYPNTYTLTKSMAEHLLTKNRENVPLAIVRPTMIGAAWKEPEPGWVDAVSAAGAVILVVGLGVVTILPGDKRKIGDHIPVDFVCNAILVAGYDIGRKYGKTKIYHSSTSTGNPLKWQTIVETIIPWWVQHRPKRSILPRAHLRLISNQTEYKAQFYMRYSLLTKVYGTYARAVQTKGHRKRAADLEKLENRANFISESFKHFILHEWFFSSRNIDEAMDNLPPAERPLFGYDVRSIDWPNYITYFCYGLQKFALKEDVPPPYKEWKSCVLKKDPNGFFSDIYWAYSASRKSQRRVKKFPKVKQIKKLVLNSTRVQNAIKNAAVKEGASVFKVEDQARLILDRMAARLHMPIVRLLAYFFKKIWRTIYKAITVDEIGVEKVREFVENVRGPLILMPTHRSYVDFLVLSYIFFVYDLPIPHIAAGEDFLNMAIVQTLFRRSGAFFMRRFFGNDELYKAVFTEYVQHLICEGIPIEFFTEGTRSRAGKLLQPKIGLLHIVTDTFFEKKVPDLILVPINITYEKVIEGNNYADELLGKSKTKESLAALVRARNVLRLNFGRINVNFGEPLSVKQYTEELTKVHPSRFDPFTNPKDQMFVVKNLAYRVAYELNQAAVIMPTNMVAAIMLTYRGGVTHDHLRIMLEWLRDEIISRGGRVDWATELGDSGEGATDAIIKNALSLLSDFVIERRNGVYEPVISRPEEFKNLLVLGFYRNQIPHLFFTEGVCACALASFGDKRAFSEEGVDREELLTEIRFLYSLLNLEFIHKPSPDAEEDFEETLDRMVRRGILIERPNGRISGTSTGGGVIQPFAFLCNMFWPFIDSYWVSMVVLYSLHPNLMVHEKILVQRMEWLAEKLYHENKLSYFESCSIETLKNATKRYMDLGVITRKKNEGESDNTVYLTDKFRNDPMALSELLEHVRRFRKSPSASSFISAGMMPGFDKIMSKI